ncbi:MAG TPA: hypothetical protein VGN34_00915 [Ktedonobacteraceae bacterium]
MGEGAVADGHRAPIVAEAATVGGSEPSGNGEGLEREGDTWVYQEDLHAAVPVEGDMLPVTGKRQLRLDNQRPGEVNLAATTEDNGFSAGRCADFLLQLGIITTVGDDVLGPPSRGSIGHSLPLAEESQEPQEQGQSGQHGQARLCVCHQQKPFFPSGWLTRVSYLIK